MTGADLRTGTMTESLVADADTLTRAPNGLPAEQGAATGLAAFAAAGMVDGLDLTPGDVVLVSGATGGVGSYAVQLAAATGADVLATARSPEGARFVTSLGATAAVDYSDDLEAMVRKVAPNGVTAVLHSAGDAAQLGDLLRRGGRLASVLGATGEQVGRYDVNVTGVAATYSPDRHGRLLSDVSAGKLVAPIGHLYPLDDAAQAFADFAAPKLGKLVILTG
jgi:NADPH:quinone reductase-like Zn-dependent oxidoreductase